MSDFEGALDVAAISLALRGLRTSVERHLEVRERQPNDVGLINISAVEAANWICALDERLCRSDVDPAGYVDRRQADEDGQVVPGVRYVRDRHMHQVVVSAESDGVNFFARFPSQLSAGVVWRPAADMAKSEQTGPKAERLFDAYVKHLERRATGHALYRSGRWLTAEVQARGVEAPLWDVQLR